MRAIFSISIILCLVPFASAADEPRAGAVTSEHLGKMLRAMGYEPQALSEEVFQVTITRDNWKVHTLVSLSPDRERIWLECKFSPIAEPERAPAAAWLRLLEENERIGPAHFVFNKDDQRVHLFKALDNVEVTPVRLREELEAFDRTARKTQSIWRNENFQLVAWTTELIAAPPRDVTLDVHEEQRRLQGVWHVVALQLQGQKATVEQLEEVKPTLTFEGETAVFQSGPGVERVVRVRLGGTRILSEIDFIGAQKRLEKGVYQLDGEILTICFAATGEERPVGFTPSIERSYWLMVLKRKTGGVK
jgi:uncharacterized protein (TIGR03067 family)